MPLRALKEHLSVKTWWTTLPTGRIGKKIVPIEKIRKNLYLTGKFTNDLISIENWMTIIVLQNYPNGIIELETIDFLSQLGFL